MLFYGRPSIDYTPSCEKSELQCDVPITSDPYLTSATAKCFETSHLVKYSEAQAFRSPDEIQESLAYNVLS